MIGWFVTGIWTGAALMSLTMAASLGHWPSVAAAVACSSIIATIWLILRRSHRVRRWLELERQP